MFSSAYLPHPSKLEAFGLTGSAAYKSKFVDYTLKNTTSHQAAAVVMGELHHFATLQSGAGGQQQDTLLSQPVQTSPSNKSSSRMTDSPSGSDSMDSSSMIESTYHGHGKSRKQRRGIIEKKRRDRINNSLAELRRLVPSAFEKQGSTKLEKAEILQMTVDHLKTIHAKGINYASNGLDPHMMGFQECVAEINRFVVQDEQFSAQDQLRSRLLSHLQCYTAQRESFKPNPPANSQWMSHYPTGPTGLVPPAPPAGLTKWDPTDSMTPSCLGTTPAAYSAAPVFSAQAPSQYSGFPTTNHMNMYMNAAASSQANYVSTRAYRPWSHGHEVY